MKRNAFDFIVFFGMAAAATPPMISHAQIFSRTETVNGLQVPIYKATVIVSLGDGSRTDEKLAYGQRDMQYYMLKHQASKLALSRVSSKTTIKTEETKTTGNKKKKGKSSEFQETYKETSQLTSVSNVEIKPIRETTENGMLKTEIELWVSPIPSLTSQSEIYPESLSTNEVFNRIRVANGQKFSVVIKKDILFDLQTKFATFQVFTGGSEQLSQINLPRFEGFLYRSRSRDLLLVKAAAYTAEMKIFYPHGVPIFFLVFTINGEKFSICLQDWETSQLPTLSELLSSIQRKPELAGLNEYFSILPTIETFNPRTI